MINIPVYVYIFLYYDTFKGKVANSYTSKNTDLLFYGGMC